MMSEEDNSIALPFTPRPAALNGELVGDVGFDPLGFSEGVRPTSLMVFCGTKFERAREWCLGRSWPKSCDSRFAHV